ncbi:hypothetical protein [Mycobacteroides abscessus]|uniref:hypothetical protein n=1 Tax=Mycobacteroides abscessus TaxID=36809 RepID=UPI0009258A70|nr:hypothetical protein [Mycobacteroides abscessus]MBE5495630.1 hypothetical protein [Mycobacteroides abscessus]SHO97220.1 Uncharacterised protein [Mycobacteroides abscessus subsp. abscessus]SHP91357.1 Uncharacterised protein [Mycobacteroides abscessus subsp. abscessus]SHP94926.1 Uncharacterised protein [Mycobacteroides abscessus subsp. abscessus]SHQ19718.1 Uncharacterised protein [Mycobacteroides abscessus subsp. abscessus]
MSEQITFGTAAPSPADMPARIEVPQPTADEPSVDLDPEVGDALDVDAAGDSAARKARNEARGLRTRLRAAEGELETLRAVADRYHRSEIEQAASGELRDYRDLLDRHDLSEFIVGGAIDADAVRKAANALATERPHLAAAPAAPPTDRPIETLTPGASPQRPPTVAGWHTALRGY